jgi:List-Bact-rpt repeat protein
MLAACAIVALAVPVVWGASRAGAAPTTAPDRVVVTRTTLSAATRPNVQSRATATWCGTPSEIDSKPNAVAGNPVHFIYAIPSDGQDGFSSIASAMQADWEAMDSWWRGQDPTRAPRADLAPFTCGQQLDLSSVRLRDSSDQLAAPESPFDLIWDSLTSSGFDSSRTKYVVYYDGPVGNEDICGVGGSVPGGFGLATVLLRACAGVSSAEVAVHELVHAMGAVPNGAPHDCDPPDDGHTCDNNRDLMYPVTDGTPLTGLILDPGRDDYYGHGGSWADIQDSPWLIQLDRQASLNLALSGPGQVDADVPGLHCTQSCTTAWNAGTRLALTPTPGPGAKLVRWSGACSGAFGCSVTAGQTGNVEALFAPVTYRLSVRVSGKGRIRSSSFGIACPGRCASAVSSHSPLRLTAVPAKGWRLKTWSGACRGKRVSCVLPMTRNTSARTVFARR